MNDLLTQPPVQIGAWLACLAFTVMLANGLIKLWAAVRGRPAPGELSERITKTEAVLDEHSRRLKALEKNDKDLRELILAENGKIYDRLKEIAEVLYSLKGTVDALRAKGAAS